MKKHLLTLCCALALALSIQSCSNDDDDIKAVEGDVEFTDLTLPQVKATIKGYWHLEKVTQGVPGSSSETDVDGYSPHNLGFKGNQVMYINTDPAANSMAPEWITMIWGTRETILGTLPFYTSNDPSVYSAYNYLIGIREGKLVTSLCIASEDGSITYSYYSRMDNN